MNILARFFATRAECAQLVMDLQEVIRDRDRWAALAQQLTEENHTQHESLEFAMAKAEELREKLRWVRDYQLNTPDVARAFIDKALGEGELQ